MLTRLDETLLHQIPTTFEHAASSDLRVFDRYWFSVCDPGGQHLLVTGMGLYKNTNVLDGFAAVQTAGDRRQHNLRLSRALRPAIEEARVGPLSVTVIEPYRALRLHLEPGEHDVSFDLAWDAFLPPVEEKPYFERTRGRVVDDYVRYDQIGRASGWIALGGERVDVRDWWAARDHSWGIRRGMGGAEPRTGPADARPAAQGLCHVWGLFSTDEMGGYLQVSEVDGVQTYLHGILQWPDAAGEPELEVRDLKLDLAFFPRTRRFSRATFFTATADGREWTIEAEPLARSFAMDGTGYDGGFDDGLGLGAYRGEYHVEADVYDLSHVEAARRPDGKVTRGFHRETPVSLSINGRPGTGHFFIGAFGPLPQYGL